MLCKCVPKAFPVPAFEDCHKTTGGKVEHLNTKRAREFNT